MHFFFFFFFFNLQPYALKERNIGYIAKLKIIIMGCLRVNQTLESHIPINPIRNSLSSPNVRLITFLRVEIPTHHILGYVDAERILMLEFDNQLTLR
jgi:hypothetical protein